MLVNFHSRAFLIASMLLIFLFSCMLTYLHTPFGAAISMDSLAYLEVAQQIILGNGISLADYSLDGGDFFPLTIWPPLYPILLSILVPSADIFGVNAGRWVTGINITGLFVALSLFWFLTRRYLHPGLALFLAVLLALLPSFQVTYMYVWSESIFIPTVFAAFYLQWRYLVLKKHSQLYLWGAVVLLALAFNIRYAGLGFLGAFLGTIILMSAENIFVRVRHVLISMCLYSLCISPLLIRNYLVSHTLAGKRAEPVAGLFDDLLTILKLLQNEFFPYTSLFFVLCVAVIFFAIFCVIKLTQKTREFLLPVRLIICSTLWFVSYLVFLLLNRQVSHSDLDPRMMAPIVPFILLVLALLFDLAARYITPVRAFVPLSFLAIGLVFSSVKIHQEIVSSWRATGTPGVIQGVAYNSTTNKSFDGFKEAGNLIKLPEGAILLTDVNRPQVIRYFFPSTRVKYIPDEFKTGELRALKELKQQGFVLLTTDKMIGEFEKILGGTEAFLQLKNQKGEIYPGFVLLRLPIVGTP